MHRRNGGDFTASTADQVAGRVVMGAVLLKPRLHEARAVLTRREGDEERQRSELVEAQRPYAAMDASGPRSGSPSPASASRRSQSPELRQRP